MSNNGRVRGRRGGGGRGRGGRGRGGGGRGGGGDLLQRRAFTWDSETSSFANIAPSPDKLTFFTKEFEECEAQIDRKNTPYFICKYFNPRFFDKEGNKLPSIGHGENELTSEEDIYRSNQYDKACDVIHDNKRDILRNAVRPDFISDKKLMYEMHIIVLLYAFTGRRNCLLKAFATCSDQNLNEKENKENVLYIDVIGAKNRDVRGEEPAPPIPLGTKMIENIIQFARTKQYLGLSLSSITYVIGYYRKLGFRHLPNLREYEIVEEDEDITDAANLFCLTRYGIKEDIDDYIFTEHIDRKYDHVNNNPYDEILNEMKEYWEAREKFVYSNGDHYSEDEKDDMVKDAYNKYKLKFPETLEGEENSNIGLFIGLLCRNGFSVQNPEPERRKVDVAIKNWREFYGLNSNTHSREQIYEKILDSSAGLDGWYRSNIISGSQAYGNLDKEPFEKVRAQDEGFKMTLQFEDVIENTISNNDFIIFIDLETSGLPVMNGWKYPDYRNFEAYDTCRIIQVGAMICEADSLTPMGTQNTLIRAQGFEISEESFNIHGITKEKTLHDGMDFDDFIKDFRNMLLRAKFIAAHNAFFDVNVLKSEIMRQSEEGIIDDKIATELIYHIENKMKVICTMKNTKEIVGARNQNGRLKNPSLKELYRFATSRELEDHHDAMCDVINIHYAVKTMMDNKIFDLYKKKRIYKKKDDIDVLREEMVAMRKENAEMRKDIAGFNTSIEGLCLQILNRLGLNDTV